MAGALGEGEPADRQSEDLMPLYDYDCKRCGAFRDWGRLATADEPQPCPSCGRPADRSISSPHMRCGESVNRYKAEAFNERSANEPKVVQHVGHMGHGHGKDGHKHHAHQHARRQLKSADRPWMVGH